MTQPQPRSPRYPLQSLADALHITLGDNNSHGGLLTLATRLGISHRQAQRAHQHGLSWIQADTYAIAAKLHPAVVWPQWLTDTPLDHHELAA